MIVLEYILLVGVIVCAIAAPLCKRPVSYTHLRAHET